MWRKDIRKSIDRTPDYSRQGKLREAILRKHPSVRQFVIALEGGVEGDYRSILSTPTNYYVLRYLNICAALRLDPFDLEPLDTYKENHKEMVLENRLMALYCDLNHEGRDLLINTLYDIHEMDKYRRV